MTRWLLALALIFSVSSPIALAETPETRVARDWLMHECENYQWMSCIDATNHVIERCKTERSVEICRLVLATPNRRNMKAEDWQKITAFVEKRIAQIEHELQPPTPAPAAQPPPQPPVEAKRPPPAQSPLFSLSEQVAKQNRKVDPPPPPSVVNDAYQKSLDTVKNWNLFDFAVVVGFAVAGILVWNYAANAGPGPFDETAVTPANRLNVMLRIRRTQRFTLVLRRPRFILHFKADVSPEEIALIKKYKLWRSHLYTSEEFKQRLERLSAPTESGLGALKALLGFFTKAFSWVATAFALKITVRTLVRGKRVEKNDLGDLISLEQQVIDTTNTLKQYLNVARTFDGRVETIEI